MRTFKLTLSYDGTDFAGWQTQPRQRTVQQTLEQAIQKITGMRSSVLASGRTDAGVHALAQVASFHSETQLAQEVLKRAINAQLPQDIAVHCVEEAAAGFHPIRDALRKRYRYVIYDGPVRDVFQLRYSWQFVYGRLNEQAMRRAAQALLGTHDFSSYETSGAPRKSSIRTVFDLAIQRGRGEGEGMITLEIEANGFLYNMVRNIVGTLVEVGRGANNEDWPQKVLEARDRCQAGRTAPPQGLYLLWVQYGPAVAGNPDSSALDELTPAEG